MALAPPPRRALLLIAALAVAAAIAGLPRAAGGEPPGSSALTNEDVVRMVMSGTPVERILARIAEAEASFDVDPGVVEELRRAGVPEEVVRAMIAKARPAAPAAPAAAATPAQKGIVEIVFDTDPKAGPAANSFAAPAVVTDPNARLKRPITVAFAVTCGIGVHVPDHWTSATPLDPRIGRHEILFFRESTAAADPKEAPGMVYLDHPSSWRFEADAGAHAGSIVAAARAGDVGPFIASQLEPYTGLVVEPGRITRIDVRLRSHLRPHGRDRRRRDAIDAQGMTALGTLGEAAVSVRWELQILKIHAPEPEPRETPAPAP